MESRSDLIDITLTRLQHALSDDANLNSTFPIHHLKELLQRRVSLLKEAYKPFGSSNAASRTQVKSGKVKLTDGTELPLDEIQDIVLAASDKFGIDEIWTAVLLKSFLWNQGLPDSATRRQEAGTSDDFVKELLTSFTPFYTSERLSLIRMLVPLFRAFNHPSDPLQPLAAELLDELLPTIESKQAWIQSILSILKERRLHSPPADILKFSPRQAAESASQAINEQLVLLELLFFSIWSFITPSFTLIHEIWKEAMDAGLGSLPAQSSRDLLRGAKESDILQDVRTFWIVVCIETLGLEQLTVGYPEIPALMINPNDLKSLRSLLSSTLAKHHEDPFYAPLRLALSLFPTLEVNSESDLPTFRVTIPRGSFTLLTHLIYTTSLFNIHLAWSKNSVLSDPGSVAARSIVKGFLMATLDRVSLERLHNEQEEGAEELRQFWEALFGFGEENSVYSITRQFWEEDFRVPPPDGGGSGRRGLLDIVRSRFPLQSLLPHFLCTLCGYGSQNNPRSMVLINNLPHEDVRASTTSVFYYMLSIPSFCMILRPDNELGKANLIVRRPGGGSGGSLYTNLRALDFAGGGMLAPNSMASLMGTTEDGGFILSWDWSRSGGGGWNAWKFVLEILRTYVEDRTGRLGIKYTGKINNANPQAGNAWYIPISDLWFGNDARDIAQILDLIRYVLGGETHLAGMLVGALEGNGDFSSSSTLASSTDSYMDGADLVELITLILEDALSRRTSPSTEGADAKIVVSSLSVLRSLLGLPAFVDRVWTYLRSSTVLFPPQRALSSSTSSRILHMERTTGYYPITLSLLSLIRSLFVEFIGSLALTPLEIVHVKQEVLGLAIRFVTSEIWSNFWRWRFENIGDKFEMGRMLADIYNAILEGSSPKPVQSKSWDIIPYLEATFSGGNEGDLKLVPLIETLRESSNTLDVLYDHHRYADARKLVQLLEGFVTLTRSLVERRTARATTSHGARLGDLETLLTETRTISAIASYVWSSEVGDTVPLESIKLLCSLAASPLLNNFGVGGGLYKQLSDPEATVRSLVRIVRSRFHEDPQRRIAIWEFGRLCLEHQPALARLFVQGSSPIPASSDSSLPSRPASLSKTLLKVGLESLANAEDLWDNNPQYLASIIAFLNGVWEHAIDHEKTLKAVKTDKDFWSRIDSLLNKDLGPPPEISASLSLQDSDSVEATVLFAYRTVVKAKSLNILALDVQNNMDPKGKHPESKGGSWSSIEKLLVEEQLTDQILEGVTTSFDPQLHARIVSEMEEVFPVIDIESISLQPHPVDREFGASYLYPLGLLRERFTQLQKGDPYNATRGDRAISNVAATNLNWSLADAQMMLTKSWRKLLLQLTPYMRSKRMESIAMALAEAVAGAISAENRSGSVIVIVHSERLQILLAFLEVAWFEIKDEKSIKAFIAMSGSLNSIIRSEAFPPLASMRNQELPPYHSLLLQVVFYFARISKTLRTTDKPTLQSSGHIQIAMFLRSALHVIIEGLRQAFDASTFSNSPTNLLNDIQLLIATFHHCSRKEIGLPVSEWLPFCRQLSLCDVSLKLMDMARSTDRTQLLAYLLFFQLSLTSVLPTAQELVGAGCLPAYSRLPVDLPSDLWCTVLSVITGLVSSLGYETNFIELDVCAFIQVHGERIAQILSWNIDDTITSSFLEELEQVTELFYVFARVCRPFLTKSSLASQILQAYNGPALSLLQQLNYAFAHPNHLVSLIEPMSSEEVSKLASELPKDVSFSLSDLLDDTKKPITSRYVQRVSMITNNLLLTLHVLSGAGNLLGNHSDWEAKVHPLLTPHAKVSLSEPASIGTISELASSASLSLRNLGSANKSSGTIVPQLILQQLLEMSLTLVTTQIVAWLISPSSADPSGEMDVDDYGKSKGGVNTRIKRELTGELAVDTASLLLRCQSVLDKIGIKKDANLALLLRGFLEERVLSNS